MVTIGKKDFYRNRLFDPELGMDIGKQYRIG